MSTIKVFRMRAFGFYRTSKCSDGEHARFCLISQKHKSLKGVQLKITLSEYRFVCEILFKSIRIIYELVRSDFCFRHTNFCVVLE